MFDEESGTKVLKPDLEAACRVEVDGEEAVLLMGSGSSPRRMTWCLLRVVDGVPDVTHTGMSELYADVARANRVLHDLCTDVWSYVSLGYFSQVRGQGTVGSSTMPHKVNPIRFENAEANL